MSTNLTRIPSENPHPILRIAADGTVLYANAAGETLVDSLGSGVGRMLPAGWDELNAAALGSESKKTIDVGYEGRIFSFEVVRVSEADYVNWYGRDVTERRQIEEELRNSEERFRLLMEGVTDYAIFMMDREGHVVSWNAGAERIKGYHAEEIVGKHFSCFYPAEDMDSGKPDRELEEAQASGRFEEEGWRVRKDGSRFVANVVITPVRDQSGHLCGFAKVTRDITERRLIEAKLRRMPRVFLDGADPIVIEDMEGKIVDLNDETERAYGWKREELVGEPIKKLVPPERHSQAEDLLDQCKAGRSVRNVEGLRWNMAGEVIPVLLTLSLLTDEEEKPLGVATISKSIVEQKRVEGELVIAKEAAEAANVAKSLFLANMGHEIRTPMTAILGYADLLMSHEWPPSERREHLQAIHRQGNNLLTIIDDILDLSEIEAEQVELEPMDCSPSEVMEEVRSLLQVRANEKNLGLDTTYSYPLPKTIHTDPVRLRQILVNLVGNAIKFTQRGGVKLRVRYADQQMKFEIADTGIGMTEEEIGRLFQRFTQADISHTRRFGGTGLGLHISQRLAKMLGGQIELESEPGVGSTFTLTIDPGPLEDVEIETQMPTLVTEEKPAEAGQKQKLCGRILLAEDVKEMRTLIRMNLEMLGLEVDLAENGRIALEKALASKAEGRSYDLILMDIQMPELNGYEATRRLRQDGWKGPIIALTAQAMTGDREKCLQAGCDDYISKPMTDAKLSDTVARHLDKATSAQPVPAKGSTADPP